MPELNLTQLQKLREVRSAYRQLYQFQCEILSLIKFVGEQFDIEYYGGYAKFSNQSPAQSFGDVNDLAWDWLNFYLYEFHFRDEELHYNKHVNFSVFLVADTGYFDATDADKKRPDTFAPVNASSTKLIFLVGKELWHTSFEDFPINFKSNATDYIRTAKKGFLLARSFDLADFANNTAAIQSLRSLVRFWEEHGMYDLKLKNR